VFSFCVLNNQVVRDDDDWWFSCYSVFGLLVGGVWKTEKIWNGNSALRTGNKRHGERERDD